MTSDAPDALQPSTAHVVATLDVDARTRAARAVDGGGRRDGRARARRVRRAAPDALAAARRLGRAGPSSPIGAPSRTRRRPRALARWATTHAPGAVSEPLRFERWCRATGARRRRRRSRSARGARGRHGRRREADGASGGGADGGRHAAWRARSRSSSIAPSSTSRTARRRVVLFRDPPNARRGLRLQPRQPHQRAAHTVLDDSLSGRGAAAAGRRRGRAAAPALARGRDRAHAARRRRVARRRPASSTRSSRARARARGRRDGARVLGYLAHKLDEGADPVVLPDRAPPLASARRTRRCATPTRGPRCSSTARRRRT